MTTSISSGPATFINSISIGDQVNLPDSPMKMKGTVIEMCFSKTTLRGCVRYTDFQGRLQIDWIDLDQLTLATEG